MTSTYASIAIQQFELPVILGWPEEERLQAQSVFLDIYIRFPNEPLACKNDQLQDTFCYDVLTQKIKSGIENKAFHLIEFLSREIYQLIKQDLPLNYLVTISINKHPPIAGLKGGVHFWYGDEKKLW